VSSPSAIAVGKGQRRKEPWPLSWLWTDHLEWLELKAEDSGCGRRPEHWALIMTRSACCRCGCEYGSESPTQDMGIEPSWLPYISESHDVVQPITDSSTEHESHALMDSLTRSAQTRRQTSTMSIHRISIPV
jgi:hypothetical protein